MIREDGSILFDPENCDDCKQTVIGWEAEFDYNKMIAPYMNNYKNQETQSLKYRGDWIFEIDDRLVHDPVKARTYKRHKNEKRFRWDKEIPCIRRKIQRKFKTKMKKHLYNEVYYNPTLHDYRTYGWETF